MCIFKTYRSLTKISGLYIHNKEKYDLKNYFKYGTSLFIIKLLMF